MLKGAYAGQVLQPLARELSLLPVDCDRDVAQPELEPSLNRFFAQHETEVSDPAKTQNNREIKNQLHTYLLN